MAELDWVRIECPECGMIGERARGDGRPTETPLYVKCPRCRARDGDEQLDGHQLIAAFELQAADESLPGVRRQYFAGLAIMGLCVALGFALGSIRRN